MSPRKLFSIVIVAAIAGFATVGTLTVQFKEYDVPPQIRARTIPRSLPTDHSGTRRRE
jgi:hypothetical protein